MNLHLPFKRIAAAGLGAALLSACGVALADPPSRIARLAYVSGPVSLAPAGESNWVYANMNRPLIPGDRLWADPGARNELQVGGAALRMGGNTMVTLLNLGERITQLQLSQGRLNVRVRQLRPNEMIEIDTPNLALTIRKPGDYRIEVDPAGDATMVAVRRGQVQVYGDGNAYRLDSGEAFRFAGTDLRDVRYARPALDDEFDRWSASRDRRIEQSRATRYVSRDLIGYEDLDGQGTWRSVPSYGNVWMPSNVGRDWAPYRDGHWSYVQPWGWTWVDDAPWGFAVSHYGRWTHLPEGWGWVPGPRAARPVYAPALVAFVSIGSGAYAQRERPVAWFPLAPREAYRPSYRASPTYITNINITNTTLSRSQIPRDGSRVAYANRQVRGAVTAIPATAFVQAQPVSKATLALPAAALAGAAIAHAAPVAPERGGMRGRGAGSHQPPQAVMARRVLAKTAPAPEFRNAARTLAPERQDGGRQLRQVPSQPMQAAPPAPPREQGARFSERDEARMNRDARRDDRAPRQAVAPPRAAPAPSPAPQAERGRNQERDEARMNRGSRRDERAPGQAVAPQQANPPAAPAPTPAPQAERGRSEREEARMNRGSRRDERAPGPTVAPPQATPPAAPTPAPQADRGRPERDEARMNRASRRDERAPGQAVAPPPAMPQPPARPQPQAAPPPQAAPEARGSRRDEMRQARENRDAAPRPMPQQAAPPPAAAPRPPEPPKPEQARGGRPERQDGERGSGKDGKRDDQRRRDENEQK